MVQSIYNTRLSKKMTMSISELRDELKTHIAQCLESIPTVSILNDMFSDFKSDIIQCLEAKVEEQDAKIKQLESVLSVRENVMQKLEVRCDDNEQYSKRSCLRINNIEYDKNCQSASDTLNKVKKCYGDMGVSFDERAIDRAHGIGRTYEKGGKIYQSLLVKFTSWNDRERFYRARPKILDHGKSNSSFSVSTHLTKRRYELLRFARGVVKDYPQVNYVFSDINCSLAIRFNKRISSIL